MGSFSFPQSLSLSLVSKGWMWCEYHLTLLTCGRPQRHTGFAGGLCSDGSETLSFHSVNEENGPPSHRPFNNVEGCCIKNALWIMNTINPHSPKHTWDSVHTLCVLCFSMVPKLFTVVYTLHLTSFCVPHLFHLDCSHTWWKSSF